MKLKPTLLALTLLGLGGTALAETLVCPDLASAVQIGACPTDEELNYTYKGYCADNARMYDKEQNCLSFEQYRVLKNIALWETRDGRFDGYVSCEPGKAALAGVKPVDVTISKQGSVTRVACTYDNRVTFTHRTKAKCVAEAAKCATDAAACQAKCE